MLDGKGEGGGRDEGDFGGYSSGPRTQASGPKESFSADLDDEIPF
jgi:single-strand DNA-binding protein